MERTFEFQVKGRWPFPLDMLRYDQAEAATSKDQELIDKLSSSPDDINLREVFTITLKAPYKLQHCIPTDARWRSFLWRVV